MREIITICIGGCGVKIGSKFFELMCLEDGISSPSDENILALF